MREGGAFVCPSSRVAQEAWKRSSVRSSYKRIKFPSDLVIELTTLGLQSLSELFLGGQRQLILTCEDLVPQVA